VGEQNAGALGGGIERMIGAAEAQPAPDIDAVDPGGLEPARPASESSWISATRRSTCGPVKGPCAAISAGLHTGTSESSISLSSTSAGSGAALTDRLRSATSTPSVVKSAKAFDDETRASMPGCAAEYR
jgi:hypothetical protein